jgi:hypothetical protein
LNNHDDFFEKPFHLGCSIFRANILNNPLTWTRSVDVKFAFGRFCKVKRIRIGEHDVHVQLESSIGDSRLEWRRKWTRVEGNQHFGSPEKKGKANNVVCILVYKPRIIESIYPDGNHIEIELNGCHRKLL